MKQRVDQVWPGPDGLCQTEISNPWTVKGFYKELVNVLNWINTVALYLDQCQVDSVTLRPWTGLARALP